MRHKGERKAFRIFHGLVLGFRWHDATVSTISGCVYGKWKHFAPVSPTTEKG